MNISGWFVASRVLPTLLGAVLLLPGLLFGPGQDAAIYATVAHWFGHGTLPYAGAWDHKPPGVYVAYAAVQLIWPGPEAWVPVWVLSLGVVVLTGIGIGKLLCELRAPRRAQVTSAGAYILVVALPPVSEGGGHTEHLAAGAMIGALLLLTPDGRIVRSIMAGVIAALGMTVSLQLLPGMLALVFYVWRRGSVTVAAFVAGAFGTAIAALVLVGVLGVLPEAIDALLRYSTDYRAMNAAQQDANIRSALSRGVLVLAPAFLPLLVGILRPNAREWSRLLLRTCWIWLATTCVWVLVQARLEGHYLVPAAIPFAILVAYGTEAIISDPRRTRASRSIFLASVVILGSVSLWVTVDASRAVLNRLAADNSKAAAMTAAVMSEADGTMYIWGNRAQVYYMTDRTSPTRFFYLAPLTTPGYSSPEQIASVLDDWERCPPSIIVDAGSPEPGQPGLPPLLIPRPVSANGRDYDVLWPLREFVASHYERSAIVAGWPIYTLGRDTNGIATDERRATGADTCGAT